MGILQEIFLLSPAVKLRQVFLLSINSNTLSVKAFIAHIMHLSIAPRNRLISLIRLQRNYPPVARAPPPEPPESSIAMLVSMGFDSNAARQALMQARNDINVATNILLEAQSR